MTDKIKELDFEDLWDKIKDMQKMCEKADDACTLLTKLYDNKVSFEVKDNFEREYIYYCEVIDENHIKKVVHDNAIEVRDRCILDILKQCREIGEHNGVSFEHWAGSNV